MFYTSRVHPYKSLAPPPNLMVEIDAGIAGLVQQCWRVGLDTRFSCQGDDRPIIDDDYINASRRWEPGHAVAGQAYIAFGSLLDAALFIGAAGPTAWTPRDHRQRHAERPPGTERWTWDWTLDALALDTVRFPARDIPRAERALARVRWTVTALIAGRGQADSQRVVQYRACRSCGTLISPRLRRDAIYCSRHCQLRARQQRPSP